MVFVSFWRAPGRTKWMGFAPKRPIFARFRTRIVTQVHVRVLCFYEWLISVEFQKSLKTIVLSLYFDVRILTVNSFLSVRLLFFIFF